MQPRLSGPPANPLARILVGLLGLVALAGAFFFGLVVLAVAIGLGALAWLFVSLRLWWLGRQARPVRDDEVIDAEYRVVSRDRDESPPPN